VSGERVGGAAVDARVSAGRRGVWPVDTACCATGSGHIRSLQRVGHGGGWVVDGGGWGERCMWYEKSGCPRARHSLQALPHTAVADSDVGFVWGWVCRGFRSRWVVETEVS